MDERYVFLDTNTFLHFQWFDEIDWPKIHSSNSVTLVLAPVILSELDEKKYEASPRVRERAKSVIKRLDRYIRSADACPCP